MTTPTYQGTYPYDPIEQGNTLRARAFDFSVVFGADPAVDLDILTASLVVYTCNGRNSFELPVSVSGNVVTQEEVSDEVTADWPVGEHVYKLKVTRAIDGVVRSQLTGPLEVTAKY